jgi:hypothetical protein
MKSVVFFAMCLIALSCARANGGYEEKPGAVVPTPTPEPTDIRVEIHEDDLSRCYILHKHYDGTFAISCVRKPGRK